MSETSVELPVTVSDRAAERIGQILKSEGDGAMLRVAVSGGGCSGFSYAFTFDDARGDDDLVIEKGAATVLIDEVSLEFLKGAEIDFVEQIIGASFQIRNPNAKSSCGCGTSFSV